MYNFLGVNIMKSNFMFSIIIGLIAGLFTCTLCFGVENKQVKSQKINISNSLFTISIPHELKGTYQVKKRKNAILLYDKISKKTGFGGFAFGIIPFKNPADHAVLPGSRKIGELKDKKGILYDIVLKQPTDVQYDYVNGISKSYEKLYKTGDKDKYIISGKGASVYYNGQGTKGEDLYKEILKKHITAINKKWDSTKLEKENMSYMYNVIASSGENAADKIGYTYYDINKDGIDELLIGEIAEGEWKGVIYDIYTMVNRKTAHVASGGSRNRYYVCDNAFVCREYSSGANESGMQVYALIENSTELYPQVGFKYDGYTNKKQPWFISYGSSDKDWENVTEQAYEERKSTFETYERFDFTPLSKVHIK